MARGLQFREHMLKRRCLPDQRNVKAIEALGALESQKPRVDLLTAGDSDANQVSPDGLEIMF